MLGLFKKKRKEKIIKVIGKIQNPRFNSLYEWVIDFDGCIVVGSRTVFHTLKGARIGRSNEHICSNLVTGAEYKEAAGFKFKVYEWADFADLME